MEKGLEAELIGLAGWSVYADARRLVLGGRVTARDLGRDVLWAVVRDGAVEHGLAVHTRWAGHRLVEVRAVCERCPGQPCVHAVAGVLASRVGPRSTGWDDWDDAPGLDAWEETLQQITGSRDDPPPEDVAVQVELRLGDLWSSSSRRAGQVLLRPLRRGGNGRWVRTGVTWGTVVRPPRFDVWSGTAQGPVVAEPVRSLLRELRRLCLDDGDQPRYGASRQGTIDLQAAASGRVWELLLALRKAGVPILRDRPKDAPVVVDDTPAEVELVADRPGVALELSAVLTAGGEPVPAERCLYVGQPAHGVLWWDDAASLRMAPLARPVADAQLGLHSAALHIPPDAEETFVASYFPALRRSQPVRTAPGVTLPEIAPAELVCTVERRSDNEVAVGWAWRAGLTTRRRLEPLHAFVGVTPQEEDRRGRLLDEVLDVVEASPDLATLREAPRTGRLLDRQLCAGSALVAVVEVLLPALRELDGVVVQTPDGLPDLHPPQAPPRVEFVSHETPTYTDWFDLAVSVTVDGESIPLADLIEAMANRQDVYVSRFGAVVRLDAPELVRLAELVLEARQLAEAPLGMLRVGRAQAGVLLDAEDVGRLSGPAADWARRLRTLAETDHLEAPPLPAGLTAELRPYQRSGFAWLATLHGLGIGGVLADDMGLGKTLQTLALVCHAREEARRRGAEPPRFLVVAPTSVVHTWEGEAARFAPGLTVAAVTETRARRRVPIADLAASADVLVTSYTLLRLEHHEYTALDWDGVVLDEAQTVKNRRTSTYARVASLRAPFRLAISGTPVENDLMELWAVLSLVAPGVLGTAGRFREQYAIRIEKDRHGPTLERLRRRIRPLVLRRTKGEVATDLPDKQEQVLALDLLPAHRTAYDRLLQRERQKVLGLIQDEEHFESNRFVVFRSLTLLRQAALSLRLVEDGAQVPSAKLEALAGLVADVAAEGHRVLVFSQFTRFLGAARDRLEQDGVECAYLDGSTTRRQEVVEGFRSGTAPVFLVSLKAGGTGLTLTEADYCVVLDPWWNPATEAQAVDRTHRIGQTRKVNVYRFVSRGTIEEKVMALKDRKADLVASVLDAGDLSSGTLTADDVRELLS